MIGLDLERLLGRIMGPMSAGVILAHRPCHRPDALVLRHYPKGGSS
jgi:hypothetical protein